MVFRNCYIHIDQADAVNVRPKAVYINVSSHAPPDQVNMLLFQLFFCGILRNRELGIVFPLPPACSWNVIIEVPYSKHFEALRAKMSFHKHRMKNHVNNRIEN